MQNFTTIPVRVKVHCSSPAVHQDWVCTWCLVPHAKTHFSTAIGIKGVRYRAKHQELHSSPAVHQDWVCTWCLVPHAKTHFSTAIGIKGVRYRAKHQELHSSPAVHQDWVCTWCLVPHAKTHFSTAIGIKGVRYRAKHRELHSSACFRFHSNKPRLSGWYFMRESLVTLPILFGSTISCLANTWRGNQLSLLPPVLFSATIWCLISI